VSNVKTLDDRIRAEALEDLLDRFSRARLAIRDFKPLANSDITLEYMEVTVGDRVYDLQHLLNIIELAVVHRYEARVGDEAVSKFIEKVNELSDEIQELKEKFSE
jgi:hypothetical protein